MPLLLGIGGWLACGRKRLATVLLLGGLLFPLYHVATGNSVGDTKHIVFGFVFLLPLGGRLLDAIAKQSGAVLARLVAIGAGAFGSFQAERLDRAWIDLRPATDYLASHARPGQTVLANNAGHSRSASTRPARSTRPGRCTTRTASTTASCTPRSAARTGSWSRRGPDTGLSASAAG